MARQLTQVQTVYKYEVRRLQLHQHKQWTLDNACDIWL